MLSIFRDYQKDLGFVKKYSLLFGRGDISQQSVTVAIQAIRRHKPKKCECGNTGHNATYVGNGVTARKYHIKIVYTSSVTDVASTSGIWVFCQNDRYLLLLEIRSQGPVAKQY